MSEWTLIANDVCFRAIGVCIDEQPIEKTMFDPNKNFSSSSSRRLPSWLTIRINDNYAEE